MWSPLVGLTLFCLDKAVAAEPLSLSNCTLPPGSPLRFSNDCKILCRPSRWSDLLVFYLGNYAAHVATIKLRPGASATSTFLSVVAALLLPAAGMSSAIRAIWSRAASADTELQTAARAGALYALVQEDESRLPSRVDMRLSPAQLATIRPGPHDIKARPSLRLEGINITALKFQGRVSLPKGWTLRPIWADAKFLNDEPGPEGALEFIKNPFRQPEPNRLRLTSSYSVVKAIAAIVQTCFAVTTLYHTRGFQIERFGYAAFGLTVTPYVVMSLVNLLASLFCPDYPSAFIVESRSLDYLRKQIRKAGKSEIFFVEGTVGRVLETTPQSSDNVPVTVGRSPDRMEVVSSRHHRAAQEQAEEEFERLRSETEQEGCSHQLLPIARSKTENRDIRETDSGQIRVTLSDDDGPEQVSETRVLSNEEGNSADKSVEIILYFCIATAVGASITLGVIGGLSGFKTGQSTRAQRVWTMMWMTFGFLGSFFGGFVTHSVVGNSFPESRSLGRPAVVDSLQAIGSLLFYGIPAIGGYVVVGQMILDYGTCVYI